MLKFFATDVSVSKGYDGSPALRFSESDGVCTATAQDRGYVGVSGAAQIRSDAQGTLVE